MDVKSENYKFFSHKECEFFPCHKVGNEDEFNCLFCYCPLYSMGENCPGNFKMLPSGIKDCSNCTFPHMAKNYDKIQELLSEK